MFGQDGSTVRNTRAMRRKVSPSKSYDREEFARTIGAELSWKRMPL